MKPVNFKGSNVLLKAPEGREGDITDMNIFTNGKCCVSCWEMERDDFLLLLNEYIKNPKQPFRFYISVLSGDSQPPIFIGTEDQTRAIVADYGEVWKK